MIHDQPQLIDFALPYQRKFIQSKAKKKLWLSSRQVGKSWAIAFMAAHSVLQKPNSIGLCISTGARAATELLKKCKQMADSIKILSRGKITYEANAEAITFSTGSRIVSLPSNPDGLRGYTASFVAMDECAFIPFVDECYQAILPTLTRDKDSELVVCSTPAGKSGLFYDFYGNADDSWYVQTTTIEDAVADGLKVDISELKKNVGDPDIWNQEYMCQFADSYGAFIDTSILDWYSEVQQGDFGYYLGMDVGRKHDRTAITVLRSVADKLYLENVISLEKCQYSDQVALVKQLHQKYNFTAGLIDAGGIGSALAEQISKEVSSKLVGIEFTAANKTPMHEAIRAKILDHKLLFNPEFKAALTQDFRNVQRIVTESGQVKFQAGRDENGHSDITSSLALAVEAARRCPVNFKAPSPHTSFSSFGRRQGIYCRY